MGRGTSRRAAALPVALLAAASFVLVAEATAFELTGFMSQEARLFPRSPGQPGQEPNSASMALQPEFYHEWNGGRGIFAFTPFLRVDTADSSRTHMDVRELYALFVFDRFELGLGARKVFWGVVESYHLVDVVNQTDLVERIDEEEKLGQPMVSLSAQLGPGTADLYFMPWFRDRTFPGRGGRFRGPLVVDTSRARFESGKGRSHPDVALRYAASIGAWEVALSHFRGTGREPTLLRGSDAMGRPVLVPYYEIVNQTGLELQLITGQWLWKAESIYRRGQGDPFVSWVSGFEYTFYGILGTRMDLGVLAEWIHDERDPALAMLFDDDVMAGARLVVNDLGGTEALFGVIQDASSPARFYLVEASRRFGEATRLTVNVYATAGIPSHDRLYAIGRDDVVEVTLDCFF
ncbi:MAG TPA: hypothetical protein ENJ37_07060 [Deltaproteobacteria bacterium]|nr:hypothetical protein [Deltaproteobacteria bacterium]